MSLYLYLKHKHYSTAKEIVESAYYDKAKQHPIFDQKTARQLLKAFEQQGGGLSKYPYMDVVIRGFLEDYTPNVIQTPVSGVYNTCTTLVDNLKSSIPFSDLVLEAVHGVTEVGVTTANDLGSTAAGPFGAVAVAPFTAVAAGLAAILSTGEGDLGGAVAHIANWVPGLGIIFNKIMVQSERLVRIAKKHPFLTPYIPYMQRFHEESQARAQAQIQSPEGGKRFSTNHPSSRKWRKTMRQPKFGL